MNEEIIELLESVTDEELDEDEAEAISKALDKTQLKELEDALRVFVENKEDLSDEINEAIGKLAGLVETLAVELEEKEEEEEKPEGEKKVKKDRSWGFTLVPHDED